VLAWSAIAGTGCFLAALLVGLLVNALVPGGNPPLERLARQDPAGFLLLLVTLPFVETLIGQWLPIALVGFFTRSTAPKVVVSSILFAALHLSNSPANALTILLVAGPVFAYTFVRWRHVSRTKAYLATSLTHAVHNGIAGAIVLAGL
jgi:membrane protease YdiL (CAAX protease family)